MVLLALLLLATPPSATGHWIVEGNVDAKPFTLHCDLVQTGEALSGTCHDFTPTGKAHRLTSGWVKEGKVRFVYQSNYLLLKFDAVYDGEITAAAMSGAASPAWKTVAFSARRG